MDLLFLTDISQVESVTQKGSQWLKNARVVTGDLTVAAELERSGIPFIDEWDYLEDADIERNWNIAHALEEHWWDDCWGGVDYHGFSLADTARRDLLMPFRAALNARTVYERLLSSYSVKQIYGFFLESMAIHRGGPAPTFRAATSVAHAVLRWLAQEADLPVSGLRCPRPLSIEGRQWSPRKQTGMRPPISHSGSTQSRVALLLSHYMRPEEETELEKRFACESGWRLVNISAWDLQPGGSLAWTWKQPEWEQQLQISWSKFKASQSSYSGPYPEIFGNPHLHFQFKEIWAQMLRAAQLGESFDVLLRSLRPSLVVLGVDCFALERTLVRIAGSQGVPTAVIFEGGFRPQLGYRELMGESDYVMVWNKQDEQQLTKYGMGEGQLRQVGSLKYSELYRSMTPLSDSNDRRGIAAVEAKRSLKLSTQKPVIVLLTGPINLGMALPFARPREHRATWREIVALAARRSDLTFIIKPHPSSDHFEFYRYVCRNAPPNLIFLEHASLDAALDASDVAVLVNYCTTAALEAMLHQIPVVFVRTSIYQASGWKDTLQENGAIAVGSVSEMEAVVDRLWQDELFRKHARADADIVLASMLGERGRSVPDALMDEFNKIALPPAMDHGCQTQELEQQVNCKLAEATRCLWSGGSYDELSSIWKSLAGLLKNAQQPESLMERVMFGISYTIGSTAKNPAGARRLLRACFSAFGHDHGISIDYRRILLNAYATAIAQHTNTGHWALARAFVWQSLFDLPTQTIRLGLFRQLFIVHIITRSRFALLLLNLLKRAVLYFREKRPAHYLEIDEGCVNVKCS